LPASSRADSIISERVIMQMQSPWISLAAPVTCMAYPSW
jgi:hypothetical protein